VDHIEIAGRSRLVQERVAIGRFRIRIGAGVEQ